MTEQKQLPLGRIQWMIWLLLFAINVLSLLQYDVLSQALSYSAINVSANVCVVYLNALVLIPVFYERKRRLVYVLLVLLMLGIVAAYKYTALTTIYNTFYAKKPEPFKWSNVLSSFTSMALIYFASVLFYITLRYFRLRQKQEQLQKKQAEAELGLLKAQVQPHFLFNTLNNIYFIAQRESPATAALLEKLSDIMRYFVDEAPKQQIELKDELLFIRNYINLEEMRMRYPMRISLNVNEEILSQVSVPPMLLIPLVENVFKHGIDKRREDNFIELTVERKDKRLYITVENLYLQLPVNGQTGGLGLSNLRSRLELLYGPDFSLETSVKGQHHFSYLNFPL
ncbi:sensor histidine kinase [Sediminibacterium ginsengisoli]|uniref:Histidine kinase n=1 Tax=Sediminibacterium ginsengisoli TaxID=413434 RepID=A0A1T4QU33_9BACT|nr:histidine kinase [Sediminibacterium ginsengisoli]SKA06788.1 Histidine kinase [Sediminibacterium ginsengisoli]